MYWFIPTFIFLFSKKQSFYKSYTMEIKRSKMPTIGTIDTTRENRKLYIWISSSKYDFNIIELISTSIHPHNVQKKIHMLYLFQKINKIFNHRTQEIQLPLHAKNHHLHLQLLALVLTPTQCFWIYYHKKIDNIKHHLKMRGNGKMI